MGHVDSWRKGCIIEEHPVPRPHGRRVSFMFKEQQEEQCCWSRTYGGEVRRGDHEGNTWIFIY